LIHFYKRAEQVWIQTPGHVSVDLLSFFATRTCQGKQEEQQSTTHQQQQPEPSHFYQEKILQKCVHSSE